MLAILMLAAFQCAKEKETELKVGRISFSLMSNDNPDGGRLNDNDVPAFASYSVSKADGSTISGKLDLYSFNGEYVTHPTQFVTGTYNLEQFLILNADNKTIYATPLANSEMAEFVEHPLPFSFIVTEDDVTNVVPEVLAIRDQSPNEFGYGVFGFEIIELLSSIDMDLEKTNPACVRVADNASDLVAPPYKVEVTIPATDGGNPRVASATVQAADLCTGEGIDRNFALSRLPQNTDVSIVFFKTPGPIPLAAYVVHTGSYNEALVDRLRPACNELSALCGTNIIDFNTTPVGSQEVLVAGCKRSGTNDILVSIAVNKSVVPTGLPTTAQLRLTVFASDIETCGEGASDFIALPTPIFVHDTPGNFQVSQYVISNSALCDTNPAIAIKVAVMNPGLVSNDAIVATTCDF
jgi:hypothetical protein